MNVNIDRQVALREQMCKSAFVKNIKRSSRSPPRRHQRPQLTADLAFAMVLDLSRTPRHRQQCEGVEEGNRVPHLCSSGSTAGTPPTASSTKNSSDCRQQHKSIHDVYALGDTVRSPSHMISSTTPEEATESIDKLQNHDFAWVKRSNGTYTYAILAYRSQGSLTFLLDGDCSTKKVSRRNWSEMVRLGNADSQPLDSFRHPTASFPCDAPQASRQISFEASQTTVVQPVPQCIIIDDDRSIVSDIPLPATLRRLR